MRPNEPAAAIAAALVLVIGMGFGRFAFTGLYPLMVADGHLSVAGGSYAASANYAGYLAGALLTGFFLRIGSRTLCAFAAVATAGSLMLLGLTLPEWAIITVRGFAGIFSAVAMVAGSHWLIQDRGLHQHVPALFAGVGIGILLSAEIIAAGHGAGLSSNSLWLVLGVAAFMLTVIMIRLQARAQRIGPVAEPAISGAARGGRSSLGAAQFIVVYGLAGFGYIITATYLPLLVRTALGSIDPAHIWAAFGLGGAPSCFLWHRLHVRWGTRNSLMLNLLIQAVGVALPLTHTPAAYVASALLVGGTFMGTATIAMPAARGAAAAARFNMLAVMTASYGVGQIMGPMVANVLYGRTHSFDIALLVAAGALVLAAALCVPTRVAGGRRGGAAVPLAPM